MTIAQAKKTIGTRITVKHKISDEQWTLRLTSRIPHTSIFWSYFDDGSNHPFNISPVILIEQREI